MKDKLPIIRTTEVEYKQQEISSPSETIFSLLIGRIKKTFQTSKTGSSNLSGRVQQLSQTAETIMQRLRDIKENLRQNLSPDLFLSVEMLMDPITRDLGSVQKLLSQEGSVVHQAKAFKKYSNWMIKAQLWLELESESETKAIIRTIILHLMQEVDEQIEQDLQVIADYEDHVLEALPLGQDDGVLLKRHLEKEMRLVMYSMEKLKEKPDLQDLQEAFEWKREIDKNRSKYFEKALHIIDEVIEAISPSSSSEEEHEYLVEVLSQIAYLEEEIPALLAEVEELEEGESSRKALLSAKFGSFAEELRELNLNLRLTPELAERIQLLFQSLTAVSGKLQN